MYYFRFYYFLSLLIVFFKNIHFLLSVVTSHFKAIFHRNLVHKGVATRMVEKLCKPFSNLICLTIFVTLRPLTKLKSKISATNMPKSAKICLTQ